MVGAPNHREAAGNTGENDFREAHIIAFAAAYDSRAPDLSLIPLKVLQQSRPNRILSRSPWSRLRLSVGKKRAELSTGTIQ